MKSLVLVVEHRHCLCGATYIAPNTRILTRHEIDNLRRSRANILLPEGEPHIPLREILNVEVPIDWCQRCFKTSNGNQFELFPKTNHLPLIFIGIPGKKLKDGGAHIEERKPEAPNTFSLSFFSKETG